MCDVGLRTLVVHTYPANIGTGRAHPLFADMGFDCVFQSVGKFDATTGKKLDSIVRHGVVARRKHYTEIGIQRCGEIRNGRGRQRTNPPHVNTRTCQTGNDGGFEELTACPSVMADDGDGTMTVGTRERPGIAEHMGRGYRQIQG